MARWDAAAGATLVAIGNFDGVHRGHRAVLGLGLERARERALEPVVLTFEPHPHVVFGRGASMPLTPVARKVELLGRFDPALRVVVEPFDLALAALSAEDFAARVLAATLRARYVVVGPDFRFGQGRTGDLARLSALGAELGFEAVAAPVAGDERGPFSSTRARRAILAGDVTEAERVLGRPPALTGRVVRGEGRGRQLGVPTANLAGVTEIQPRDGVYACLVDRVGEDGRARRLGAGVMNIGERPTVGAGRSLEAHLFDHTADLYDAILRLHLVARLRDEVRFPDLSALRAQLARDIELARRQVAARQPAPDAGGAWY